MHRPIGLCIRGVLTHARNEDVSMKVLLRANVPNLGIIGDVVEVKTGYARNYLIPQRIAIEPTAGNLKRVEAEKQEYLAKLATIKAEIQARAKLVDGKEVTISARANVDGQLYGSVGPAQIVEALAKDGFSIDEDNVTMGEPIRKLDKYEVALSFGQDVKAKISVWVVPVHEEGDEAAE
jgi:large subunit ribosomal protein L9